MLRIALDATYSVGNNLSGVGVYSREILDGLAALLPDAQFLRCYRPHRFLRSFNERIPSNSRRRPLFDRFSGTAADLFHGLNQRLPGGGYRRCIATFHDLFVLTGDYSTPAFRARFADQARRAAAEADLIIAVSAFTASQVNGLLDVEASRIRVVHHGVRISTTPDQLRERIILHVGAIQRRKNISRLVRAFGSVDSSWRLVLAGSAGFGAGEILREIEQSPARERILVPGYVTARELADWYAKAELFAFPSLDEGFGMPVLEAMANGVPVIASNRSAIPEVAGDAARLVDPENEDELASALRTLTKDQTLRTDLTVKGRLRAKEFTWEKASAQTRDCYDEIL